MNTPQIQGKSNTSKAKPTHFLGRETHHKSEKAKLKRDHYFQRVKHVKFKPSMRHSMSKVESLPAQFLSSIQSPFNSLEQHLQSLPYDSRDNFTNFYKQSIIGLLGDEPEIEMVTPAIPLSVTSGIFQIVTPGNFISFLGVGTIGLVFDEYKWVGPCKVKYVSIQMPPTSLSTRQLAVGIIDYSSGTALASANSALAYENARIFDLYTAYDPKQNNLDVPTWDVHIQGIPDKQWFPSTASNTVFWFKAYNYQGLNGTLTVGYLHFSALFKFRMYNAI
jgi:hypothetical protein